MFWFWFWIWITSSQPTRLDLKKKQRIRVYVRVYVCIVCWSPLVTCPGASPLGPVSRSHRCQCLNSPVSKEQLWCGGEEAGTGTTVGYAETRQALKKGEYMGGHSSQRNQRPHWLHLLIAMDCMARHNTATGRCSRSTGPHTQGDKVSGLQVYIISKGSVVICERSVGVK